MRISRYEDFLKEEMNLRKTLVGGAIGASTLFPTKSLATVPPTDRDTITNKSEKAQLAEVKSFVDSIETERPDLFIGETLRDGQSLPMGSFERLSYLQNKLDENARNTGIDLNLNILNTQSQHLPFKVNYFFVRGIDNLEGPFLIRILNINYTQAVNLAGHEVMFNFTKVQDINTFGARINL